MKTITHVFFLTVFGLSISLGQNLSQVRDTETDGAFPLDLRVAGGKLFFVSATKDEGTQLWVTDGTTNGAHVVAKDGPVAPTELRVFDGLLYCTSSDESIWRSDGTVAGTYKIYQGSEYDYSFAVGKVGNRLIFQANGKIWASDGTSAGTQVIANTPASQTAPAVLGSNGKLYFAGGDTAFAYQLWSTDGTPGGTTNIGVINNDGIYDLARVGPYIFIKGGINSNAHVYRSDGTLAGTAVFDVAPSASHNVSFIKTPDRLFFVEGNSLCVTTGESAQVLLTTNPPTNHWGTSPPQMDFIDVSLYFNIVDNNTVQLWKSDGTVAGTMPLGTPDPTLFLTRHQNPSDPSVDVVGWNGFIYYFAYTPDIGWGFWRFSETTHATELVADLPDNLTLAQPRQPIVYNGAIYFSAYDGLEGRKLWRSDGTNAGTNVSDNTFTGSYTSFAERITPSESGTGYFITRTQDLASATLWRTDGTTNGTQPLIVGLTSKPDPDYPESEATQVFEHDGIVYFTPHDGIHGHELWRTDGTAPGTFLIKDFYYISNGFFDPSPHAFTVFHDSVYFAANDVDHNWQLWKTDGTIPGTVRVSDVTGTGLDSITDLRVIGDSLFFKGSDRTHGGELWKSDGTSAGTALVKDISPGTNSSDPNFLGVLNGKILFSAWDTGGAATLWISDGSETGTFRVKASVTNGPLYINGGKIYKNRLYFCAQDNAGNQGLWVSDGTDAGTHIFKDLGFNSSAPYAFTVMSDALYFFATAEPDIKKLWKTYGTPEGTAIVAMAPESSASGTIGVAGGLLYFRAKAADDRDELWRSDGTAVGTFSIPLSPLTGSSPFAFTAIGDAMLFFAFDGFTGIELWRATPDTAQQPSRFANISTRGHIGGGDNILIGGFIITGTDPKKVIVRAIGPSLSGLVPDYLPDPQLKLFNSSGAQIAENDNWRQQPSASDISATGLAPRNDAEAAVIATLPPGAYTAQVSGVDGGTGIGLVEVYNLDSSPTSRVANLSARGVVMGGDDILIGGFIVKGSVPRRMIVRAIGPSLNANGVPLAGRLADPVLELFDSSGTRLATNDNWQDEQSQEISASHFAPADALESAIVITLPAGAYTAQVKGNQGATGLGLVEFYEIH